VEVAVAPLPVPPVVATGPNALSTGTEGRAAAATALQAGVGWGGVLRVWSAKVAALVFMEDHWSVLRVWSAKVAALVFMKDHWSVCCYGETHPWTG